jgi:hypothetical protein
LDAIDKKISIYSSRRSNPLELFPTAEHLLEAQTTRAAGTCRENFKCLHHTEGHRAAHSSGIQALSAAIPSDIPQPGMRYDNCRAYFGHPLSRDAGAFSLALRREAVK